MNKHTETFFKSMDYFRRARIKTLENQYDQTERDHDIQSRFETVHAKLLELVGDQNKSLLIDYTDLIVASTTLTLPISILPDFRTAKPYMIHSNPF